MEPDNGTGAAGGPHAGVGQFVHIQGFVSPFGHFESHGASNHTRTDNDGIDLLIHRPPPFMVSMATM
jgi:hypothetical protein